ncbi:hypothetical protein Taro_036807 [Colocasia esculenta]|uniref:Uncharacterized protein n=1 Tax=Colocasia esculenta TaxID=4460 RepID=A0A843W7V8_COLES|nr:hypothetical protein [Colocasia esculenta]
MNCLRLRTRRAPPSRPERDGVGHRLLKDDVGKQNATTRAVAFRTRHTPLSRSQAENLYYR